MKVLVLVAVVPVVVNVLVYVLGLRYVPVPGLLGLSLDSVDRDVVALGGGERNDDMVTGPVPEDEEDTDELDFDLVGEEDLEP